MLQIILMMLLIIISWMFMQMSHPLAIGLMLLIQTLIISLITGLMAKTFWFSYILFLIFLGGMLVLFIYVSSLASNEMFKFSSNMMSISIMLLIFTLIMFIIMDKNMISFFNNLEMKNYIQFIMNNDNSINLNKLYNMPSNFITILLINYLFLTLIAVVKITNFFYGPLRQKF
nr:NADH dehydrogenase subunit 6 [Coboldia fuscipes]